MTEEGPNDDAIKMDDALQGAAIGAQNEVGASVSVAVAVLAHKVRSIVGADEL